MVCPVVEVGEVIPPSKNRSGLGCTAVVGRSAILAEAAMALFLKFSVADQPETESPPTPQNTGPLVKLLKIQGKGSFPMCSVLGLIAAL